jgi:hypothetical protein
VIINTSRFKICAFKVLSDLVLKYGYKYTHIYRSKENNLAREDR